MNAFGYLLQKAEDDRRYKAQLAAEDEEDDSTRESSDT